MNYYRWSTFLPGGAKKKRVKKKKVSEKTVTKLATTLYEAAVDGDEKKVEKTKESLRKNGQISANVVGKDTNKRTALMAAAFWGHTAIVELLLRDAPGINVDAADVDGVTALMHASYKGNVGAAIVLLEAGADADATALDGETALMFAARGHGGVKNDRLKIVNLLIAKGVNVNAATTQFRFTALMDAVDADNHGDDVNVDIVSALLVAGSYMHVSDGAINKNAYNAFLKLIIKQEKERKDPKEEFFNYADDLIKHIRDEMPGWSLDQLLQYANNYNLPHVARDIADGAIKDDEDEITIDEYQIKRKNFVIDAIVDSIVNSEKAKKLDADLLILQNNYDDEVSFKCDEVLCDSVYILSDYETDETDETDENIDASNPEQLIQAAAAGNEKTVQILIDAGVDVNATDRDGLTALNWVFLGDAKNKYEIANILFSSGHRPLNIALALFNFLKMENQQYSKDLIKMFIKVVVNSDVLVDEGAAEDAINAIVVYIKYKAAQMLNTGRTDEDVTAWIDKLLVVIADVYLVTRSLQKVKAWLLRIEPPSALSLTKTKENEPDELGPGSKAGHRASQRTLSDLMKKMYKLVFGIATLRKNATTNKHLRKELLIKAEEAQAKRNEKDFAYYMAHSKQAFANEQRIDKEIDEKNESILFLKYAKNALTDGDRKTFTMYMKFFNERMIDKEIQEKNESTGVNTRQLEAKLAKRAEEKAKLEAKLEAKLAVETAQLQAQIAAKAKAEAEAAAEAAKAAAAEAAEAKAAAEAAKAAAAKAAAEAAEAAEAAKAAEAAAKAAAEALRFTTLRAAVTGEAIRDAQMSRYITDTFRSGLEKVEAQGRFDRMQEEELLVPVVPVGHTPFSWWPHTDHRRDPGGAPQTADDKAEAKRAEEKAKVKRKFLDTVKKLIDTEEEIMKAALAAARAAAQAALAANDYADKAELQEIVAIEVAEEAAEQAERAEARRAEAAARAAQRAERAEARRAEAEAARAAQRAERAEAEAARAAEAAERKRAAADETKWTRSADAAVSKFRELNTAGGGRNTKNATHTMLMNAGFKRLSSGTDSFGHSVWTRPKESVRYKGKMMFQKISVASTPGSWGNEYIKIRGKIEDSIKDLYF